MTGRYARALGKHCCGCCNDPCPHGGVDLRKGQPMRVVSWRMIGRLDLVVASDFAWWASLFSIPLHYSIISLRLERSP